MSGKGQALAGRGDLPALTGIRGIAAWYVVLYHARISAGAFLPEPVQALLGRGYLAVDLFFMLSGFVLWLNYVDRLRTGGIAAFPGFLARRIARIWPLHIVMLGAAIAFTSLLLALGKPADEPWGQLPLHILLVHNWGFTDRLAWNDPSWSISGEFAAYLLFPLLTAAIDWRRLPAWALILLVTGLAMLLHLVMKAGGGSVLDHDVPHLGIFRALIEFAIGTMLCALWTQWRAGYRRGFLAALLPLGLVAATPGETLAAPLLLATLLFLVALGAGARFDPLASRPIHYLGLISYSTYLVHFLLFRLFKIVFVGTALTPALFGLYLLLTLAASIILFHGVERPAQRALCNIFDRRARRPVSVAIAAE
ncbi:acyltransferase [Sphingosinicella sp. BN140058]|uniref:acyltransferase family protein n=1 Tax=Sphingosinicella sp. BN140058 TaxID=1892855 RepID=UPI0010124BF6|nr:acyltransferase [Sphingosinicella sp. BN140058]QAY76529.1 acyltransferase [Sphingosinicella sp. BN140058]